MRPALACLLAVGLTLAAAVVAAMTSARAAPPPATFEVRAMPRVTVATPARVLLAAAPKTSPPDRAA